MALGLDNERSNAQLKERASDFTKRRCHLVKRTLSNVVADSKFFYVESTKIDEYMVH